MGSVCCKDPADGPGTGLGDSNTQDSEPVPPPDLPAGWKVVPSRSRPGKVCLILKVFWLVACVF